MYLADFTHASEAESRMDDLELSVAAVLTAEATNVAWSRSSTTASQPSAATACSGPS
ncbi:hypothetical protein [Kitasatospora sp. NPDC058397]|uniref:hypothetical protein n=1 Tax=Kitasatospora TaxID=2063 RepID=UPI00365FB8F0